MEGLFSTLNTWVEGAPLVALSAAFVWGLLSVILSPCHLAGVPLIVGYVSGQQGLTLRRAFTTSFWFSFGVLITIGAIGAVTAALGRIAGDAGGWVNYLVAGVFFVIGLHLLDVLPLPFLSAPARVGVKGKGYVAAFLLGLIFGLVLGPCTFAYMAPVLAVAFRAGASAPVFAAGLLTAFGLGHCLILAAAGTSGKLAQRVLDWNESSTGMKALKKACGVLVILGGLYIIYRIP